MNGSMRISARVVASSRPAVGARVPLTTVSMRGDKIMLWTIIPVERGDRLDCISSLSDGRLVRARCTVQSVRSRPGTWLVHAECTLDEPGDASTAALLQAMVGAAGLVQTANGLVHIGMTSDGALSASAPSDLWAPRGRGFSCRSRETTPGASGGARRA